MDIEQIAMVVFLGVALGQWLTVQQLKGLLAPKNKKDNLPKQNPAVSADNGVCRFHSPR
jgi:hypothetical protein